MRYVIEEGKYARSSWYVAEDGHIYLKKSAKKSKVYVRCKHERDQKTLKCSATGVIDGDELIVNRGHNHGPPEGSLELAHAYVALRSKAREAAGALCSSAIFDEVAREEGVLMGYSAAKQVIQRERKFYRSPQPATAAAPATAVAPIAASQPKVEQNIAFSIVTEDEEQEFGGQCDNSPRSARATGGEGSSLSGGSCPDHGVQTCSSLGGGKEEQNSEAAEVPAALHETEYVQLDSSLSDLEDEFDISVHEEMESGGEDEDEEETGLGGLGEAGRSGLRVAGFAVTPQSGLKRGPPANKFVAKRAKTSDQSHNELVLQTLDELSRREEDPDRSFLLSLLPYLKKMPENVRARAKTHVLTHLTECAYPIK